MAVIYERRETLVKVANVSLTLGGNLILRDVDLEIKNVTRPGCLTGQVVAMLGPSGIGKTQLFNIMSGLRQPDSGTVHLTESDKPVERGMVGVVAQHYPLFAHRSVLGNLVVAGQRLGLSSKAAREKAFGFLERFGLADRARLYPSQLSGGQRQRVAILQQLMCSGHFLLMDEPFSGLDPLAKDRACELISEVANMDDFNTLIVVTHDIDAAITVSDTLWLLGWERDHAGKPVPGARLVEEINLIDRGLCWRPGVQLTPEFSDMVREVKGRFPLLDKK